jgi:hypothetical protein
MIIIGSLTSVTIVAVTLAIVLPLTLKNGGDKPSNEHTTLSTPLSSTITTGIYMIYFSGKTIN